MLFPANPPTTAPTTPPTAAPTGPPTAPIAAPLTAPNQSTIIILDQIFLFNIAICYSFKKGLYKNKLTKLK